MGPSGREADSYLLAMLASASRGPLEDNVTVHQRGRLRSPLHCEPGEGGSGGPRSHHHGGGDIQLHGRERPRAF